MKKFKIKNIDIVSIAAILVTISSLFASVSWISSSKAGGQANDLKTAALGFMILRLESSTQASTELVQAQSYLTQAGMYYAESDAENNSEIKSYLYDLGNQSLEMSYYHSSVSENAEKRAESYYYNYSESLGKSIEFGKVTDMRSTGALIFTVSAIIASAVILFKRKEIIYVYFPIFILGLGHLIISLF